MAEHDPKADLHSYLRAAREAMVWKMEGASEYGVRRPMTPTGTNLLGMVKHLAAVEAGYFGATFDRPLPDPPAWFADETTPNVDMWAGPDETREQIVELYRRVCAHADATIEALPLDATGRVPWWPPERAVTTLHRLLVHMVAETNRHAGHADIVRELVDGNVGLRAGNSNLPDRDAQWWANYRERLEKVAAEAGG